MNRVDIGYLAGFLTTAAWLPQLWRNWQMRSAAQISWGYLTTFGSGVFLWFVYGLVKRDDSLIIANGVTTALVLSLVALKFTTRSRAPRKVAGTEADLD